MANELLQNLEKLHTTELGVVRIKQNLGLKTDDVISWCKEKIRSAEEKSITRKGKNWYIKTDGCTITVNAYSYTVITAHKEEENKNNTTHKKSAGKRWKDKPQLFFRIEL